MSGLATIKTIDPLTVREDGALTSVPAQPLNNIRLLIGDRVYVVKIGRKFYVLGTTEATQGWTSLAAIGAYVANLADLGGVWDAGSFSKIDGIVYLRGFLITSAAFGTTAALFTMPVGYRITPLAPATQAPIGHVFGSGPRTMRLYMDTSGVVHWSQAEVPGSSLASGTNITLGGVVYPADS